MRPEPSQALQSHEMTSVCAINNRDKKQLTLAQADCTVTTVTIYYYS